MTHNPAAAEFARLGEAVSNAMNDSMVERLTATAGNALEVVDKLNDPDVREGLATVLEALGQLQRTGALQTVVDLLFMIHAARSAMTDSMVDRAFAFIEHMANHLATEDIATLAHEAKGAMEDAVEHCNIPQSSPGIMGTLKMLSRPETQEAMRFMLAFACSLKSRTTNVAKI